MRRPFRSIVSALRIAAIYTILCAAPFCPAQQQAADNDQATPAVSGTGNAGRIALWKTSTTLGNSVLSQSGGNVGIGMTTPGSKLDVAGDI
jgi:hypothetical protein